MNLSQAPRNPRVGLIGQEIVIYPRFAAPELRNSADAAIATSGLEHWSRRSGQTSSTGSGGCHTEVDAALGLAQKCTEGMIHRVGRTRGLLLGSHSAAKSLIYATMVKAAYTTRKRSLPCYDLPILLNNSIPISPGHRG